MKKRGVGYASIFYGTGYGNGFPDESRAIVELTKEGEIIVYVEVSDVGSGGISVMWQIAVEALAVSKEKVKIKFDDTSIIKDSGTAAASRQTYNTGNAVLRACQKLKEQMLLAKIEGEDLSKLYQIMIERNLETKAEGYFKAKTSSIDLETGQGNPYWPYTFALQKATVDVDLETGKVDLIEIIALNDAGKIVNPVLAEGQVIGGCAMGIGYAIMEEIELEQGKIKNLNFTDYIIPTSMDIPNIKTYFIEESEQTGPFGAKGLGEPVMIPTAPAIMNAIYDAIGVRIKELPATSERILKALQEKSEII